jgi:hypothetical protein
MDMFHHEEAKTVPRYKQNKSQFFHELPRILSHFLVVPGPPQWFDYILKGRT